jgi:hypothetical protein
MQPNQNVDFLHPLFLDARRLLDALPVIDDLDIREDEVRTIAALHAQRRVAEEATERLIAFLDEVDAPDEDLEDIGDDEPSLGSLSSLGGSQNGWAAGRGDDLEEEHDGREDGGDDEPSIGVQYGGEIDLEDDRSDEEPSLGWLTHFNQGRHDFLGDTADREPNGDEKDGVFSDDETSLAFRSDPADRIAADEALRKVLDIAIDRSRKGESYDGPATTCMGVPIIGAITDDGRFLPRRSA